MNQPKQMTISTVTMSEKKFFKDTLVLSYSIDYPQFSSRRWKVAARRMNAYYQQQTKQYVRYLNSVLLPSAIKGYQESIQNGFPFHAYEAVSKFTVCYNQDCLVSLYTDRYEYTGGAHGSTVRTSDTWYLNAAIRLPLRAFCPENPGFVADLKAEIIRQIRQQINHGNNVYFENYPELVNQTFSPQQFYLTNEGLVIYFQQYDIAPYSTGMPSFVIPYGKFGLCLPSC